MSTETLGPRGRVFMRNHGASGMRWLPVGSNRSWTEQSVAYHYVTTAGFQTSGTMTFDGTRFTSVEKVTGNSGGTTEVRATGEVRTDGSLCIKSEHHRDGRWVPGRETTYREAPEAEVVFK